MHDPNKGYAAASGIPTLGAMTTAIAENPLQLRRSALSEDVLFACHGRVGYVEPRPAPEPSSCDCACGGLIVAASDHDLDRAAAVAVHVRTIQHATWSRITRDA